MFVILAIGVGLWLIQEWARKKNPRLAALVRPFAWTAFIMPLITVGIGVYRHVATPTVWLGANSLALLLAAGFYFWRGIERPDKRLIVLAGAILNIALILLWRELAWSDPQFFMIPIGISVLALVQILREEIPERFHDPLRYLGALLILVSPTFNIVAGAGCLFTASWSHPRPSYFWRSGCACGLCSTRAPHSWSPTSPPCSCAAASTILMCCGSPASCSAPPSSRSARSVNAIAKP